MFNPYPQKCQYSYWYKYPQAIALKWYDGIADLKINFKSFLPALCCLLTGLFFVFKTNAQGPCPSSNCVSGDIRITKVELLKSDGTALPNTCTPGNNIQVMLRVTFDVTSNTRYGFLVVANVYINNSLSGTIANCDPATFSQGIHTMDVSHYTNGSSILWPCGSTIQLRDVYTAWDQQVATISHPGVCTYLNSLTGSISDCSTIAPKCKFYGDNEAITVVAPLIASFTAEEGTCSNLKRTWTFTSITSGGTTPYTYTWNFGDGTPNLVTTQNPVTHEYAYLASGNHTITLSVEDASSPTHQVSVAQSQIISVTSCCVASTDPTGASAASPAICLGGNTNISVTGGSLGTGASWKWYIGGCGSGASIGTGATINVNPTTTTTYYARAEGDCGNSNCASVTVTVKTPSTNPTSASAEPSTICSGNSTSLSVTGGSLGTGASWKWYIGGCGSGSSIGSSSTINVSPTTTTTYYVRAEGDCNNSSCASVTVNVKTLSSNPTGAVAAAPAICIGNNTNIGVVGGSLGTGASWKWYIGGCGNGSSIGTGVTINVSPASTTTYYVRAEGDCNNSSCASVQVSVSTASVGGAITPARTICSGSNSGLLTLSGYTGTILRWESSPNGNAPWSTINNTNDTYTSGALSSDIWFRAIVKSGVCSETNSSSVKITVQQPISNNIIAADQIICSGNTPNGLTGSLPGGGSGSYTYQWKSKTTGGFGNILGATDINYAPGALTQTTYYQRIVSGGVCNSSTGNTVTISISPESTVYPIMGSNFCASAPSSGTITLMGSYPGVSYQLKLASDNSDVQGPQTGTGAALTWSGLNAGEYYIWGTGIAPTYCTSKTANAKVFMFDCSVFYTLTQGYYGGKNGKSCIGTTPVNTIKYLLGIPDHPTDLVIGSTKSLTIPATDDGAKKLNSSMPGGGAATGLPGGNCIITDNSCFKEPEYLTKQNRINNVLLSQTITLSLNTRWNDGELLLFPIKSGYLTTQKMTGCGPDATLVTTCSNNTVTSILMNQHVVDYLGNGATVKDLLQLANDVLGGTAPAGAPSYSDVNDAIDAINQSFDEGRRFLDYFANKQTCELLFPAPAITQASTTASTSELIVSPINVTAYPNPYTDKINFSIDSKISGYGSLQVYNMMGQKVKTIYQGYILAGRQNFTLSLPAQQHLNLVYVLRIGNKQVAGKLLQLNK